MCERGRGFFGRWFSAFHISSTIFASYIPILLVPEIPARLPRFRRRLCRCAPPA
nr:MAG TPA: hypothetical protein [Caudoviricetes sp.]DAZ55697.1 MAG TPA: hypothetical protein [Caudoviricetes sp.]DAZ64249.1 MAG TPA: hypothetical protein [Caudoviricetes sp.]